MIARVWHGWTKPENANTYENLLRDDMFPSIRRIEGSHGAYLLRRPVDEEVEFGPSPCSFPWTRCAGLRARTTKRPCFILRRMRC